MCLDPSILFLTAARLGIEPRLEASKAPVLPLDDLAIKGAIPFRNCVHLGPVGTRETAPTKL